MQKTRGQAAMEFLMTYGWAILAALIVVAAIGIYFRGDLFSTSNQAFVNPPFSVIAFNVNDIGDNVQIEIKNTGPDKVTVNSVKIVLETPSANTCEDLVPIEVPSGSQFISTVNCPADSLSSGSTLKGHITVSFKIEGNDLTITSTGSITSKIS